MQSRGQSKWFLLASALAGFALLSSGSLAVSAPRGAAKEEFKKITKAPSVAKPDAANEEIEIDEGEAAEPAQKTDSEKKGAKPAKAPKSKAKTPKSKSTMNEASQVVLAAAAAPAVAAPAPAAKPAASAPQADASKVTVPNASVPAEQSLKWLTNGNVRFMKKSFRADGRADVDRKRLLKGEHPHAIVLSCADSRVPPELVFDQALGEIFTIRVAGEALDSSVIASIEYAIVNLGSRLLVVMGHTQCGAVEASLKIKEGQSAGSEALDKLIADIRPRMKTVTTEKTSPHLEVESALNADGAARDLVKRSEIVRKKVESGELVIKAALYRMDSGKVSFY